MIATFLSGCANHINPSYSSNKVQKKKKEEISKNLLDWNKKQKITLLPHQLIPIDYLEKHNSIPGLLVYHYLGTGKTYLALGFAERNPNKKVILFVPRFLRGHWIKNMKNYGVKNPTRYEIISHKDGHKLINKDLSKTIVIVDESHRIIRNLESANLKVADTYSKAYLNIKKSHKMLLLTGTPIFGAFTDLAYQANWAANKEVLPYNKEEFKVKLMKIKQNRSALVGYFAENPIIRYTLPLTSMMLAAPMVTSSLVLLTPFIGMLVPTIIRRLGSALGRKCGPTL